MSETDLFKVHYNAEFNTCAFLIQKKRLTDKIMETAPEKYSNTISDNVFKNIGRTAYNLIRDFY